jgi:hypothetical protein
MRWLECIDRAPNDIVLLACAAVLLGVGILGRATRGSA